MRVMLEVQCKQCGGIRGCARTMTFQLWQQGQGRTCRPAELLTLRAPSTFHIIPTTRRCRVRECTNKID
ncbi:hypothetical protein BDY17DRAFT_38394 [Neohortaea acidophila]|uniref:Uncharacterized protein n=1 Tax=Neohortaea acidophila TaxID=245834 RepID=A0A6A6PHF0_9PEZI|nr:uncharacterized protein BDY17DRAFT_38394 [Neohortaea acidophila]KAF2479429.1 hypothetical protein BDY17DRAFT_38394 [Neohortaea acidophila]